MPFWLLVSSYLGGFLAFILNPCVVFFFFPFLSHKMFFLTLQMFFFHSPLFLFHGGNILYIFFFFKIHKCIRRRRENDFLTRVSCSNLGSAKLKLGT